MTSWVKLSKRWSLRFFDKKKKNVTEKYNIKGARIQTPRKQPRFHEPLKRPRRDPNLHVSGLVFPLHHKLGFIIDLYNEILYSRSGINILIFNLYLVFLIFNFNFFNLDFNWLILAFIF